MSTLTISIDFSKHPTAEQVERLSNLIQQWRTEDDIRRDNAEAQADYDRAREQQEWTLR
jgi:hypothetical protein